MNKILFHILSWTWGLPMTLIGKIAELCLMIAGNKPKKFGWCDLIVLKSPNWGGVTLGNTIIVCSDAGVKLAQHEHGHAIQNCYFGFLFPFLIGIPSAIRYHIREYKARHHIKITTPYEGIWFEKQATDLGKKYFTRYGNNAFKKISPEKAHKINTK